ncbi:MAG: pilus assembly protein PilM, partial [Pirellulaceae bacterium]
AVRAVHLRRSDSGEVTMVNCWQEAFEQPLCRAGLDTEASDIRGQGLQRMAQRIAGVDVPVWVNLPGRDVLGRFLRLPPMKDREVSALLDKEVDRQFPIGRDELMIAKWLQSEKEANDDGSRCGALIACRDRVALERLALFNDAGIEPAAVQCDPLALVNFAAFEFHNQFSEQRCEAASPLPSLAFIDAGATAVTFLVVSGTAFWFRSLDGGGEDFTAQLARGGVMTAEQAEKCKRDPATLRAPSVHFAPIEERCAATGKRLQQAVKDADDFMPPFQTDAVWTFGGASLMHGWISHVLGEQA